jgi:HD-like signal output (HDOD) protein
MNVLPQEYLRGDLETWVEALARANLPVLRSTSRELNNIATEDDDSLNPRDVAAIVLRDPLTTARLYLHAQKTHASRQLTEITTVDRMIVMLGLSPVLRAFSGLPTVEDRLRHNIAALSGLIRVVQRAHRASRFAGIFAARRNDVSFEEIMVSAMLHDLAEMLVWIFAPTLALQMRARLDADSTLRSAVAQEEVLGVRLHDLQLELARRWHLPALLTALMDDTHADQPRVRNVTIAVNIARHSMSGWDNAALPDDYLAAAELLSTTPAHVLEMIHDPC